MQQAEKVTDPAAQVEVLKRALWTIIAGSKPTGRWIQSFSRGAEAIDGYDREDETPEGYYPEDEGGMLAAAAELEHPDPPPYPEHYGPGEIPELRLVGGKWCEPAFWDPYSLEEQIGWLSSCAAMAESALSECGLPLEEPRPAPEPAPALTLVPPPTTAGEREDDWAVAEDGTVIEEWDDRLRAAGCRRVPKGTRE